MPFRHSSAVTTKFVLIRGGMVGLLLLVLLIISPGVGTSAASITWYDAWRSWLGVPILPEELIARNIVAGELSAEAQQIEADIFAEHARLVGFTLRMPRSLLALEVGITLALCGAAFQVLFRNPLATPYTLGVSSGGALGALVAIRLGMEGGLAGVPMVAIMAFLFGLAVVGLMLVMSRRKRLTSNEFLLAGVSLGMFCSAMMMVLTHLADERQTLRIVRWMMGSLETVTHLKGGIILPFVVPAWIILLLSARAMNQYRLGDDIAESRGIAIARLQLVAVLVTTLAVASVVAMCGPIGFVGLVVPHMASLIVGSDCRVMFPVSALLGGAFLMICDWISQLALPVYGSAIGKELGGMSLPVGVVTAVIGVPVFLFLLARRKTYRS